jgi:hypothetical protein
MKPWWQIILIELVKTYIIFLLMVFFWLFCGVLFMHYAQADDTIPRIEPNVLTCQKENGDLFFIFLNKNMVISTHVGKKLTCVDVLDTNAELHHFCKHLRINIKCHPSLGYKS